jgi:hypothetical protein
VRTTALALGLALGIVGCTRPYVPIPTSAADDPFFDMAGVATLVVADGCLWARTRDGKTCAVIWPHGFTARLDPGELIDQDGNVVARQGQEFGFGAALAGGGRRSATGGTASS